MIYVNRKESKANNSLDGTNAISQLKCVVIFPKQTILKDSHLKTFLRNIFIFHSEHSHNLQFHVWNSACKWGLT